MEKIQKQNSSGSQYEPKDHLLCTFFRDSAEELLLEEQPIDRLMLNIDENKHLRDDVTIFDMLLSEKNVSVWFLRDRIEVRSTEPPAIC